MSTTTTIAIIGATESSCFLVAKRLAQRYRVLLFDKDEEKLLAALHHILTTYPSANAEAMICPADASWEADIIIVSGYYCGDSEISEKIKNVSTGKIVIIIADEINIDISLPPVGNLQHLLPYSKLIQVLNVSGQFTADLNKNLVIRGNDEEALATVSSIFNSIDFHVVKSLTQTFNN